MKVSRQTGSRAESSDSSEGEDCVSDDSNMSHSQGQTSHPVSRGGGYTAKMIKTFLQETKNMKGVILGNYFPDKESFCKSAKGHNKNRAESDLTD